MCHAITSVHGMSQHVPGLHTDVCSSLSDHRSVTSLAFQFQCHDITQFLKFLFHDLFAIIYVCVSMYDLFLIIYMDVHLCMGLHSCMQCPQRLGKDI